MTLTRILDEVAKNAKSATTSFETIGKNAFSSDIDLMIWLVTLNKLQQIEITSKTGSVFLNIFSKPPVVGVEVEEMNKSRNCIVIC